MLLFNKRNYLGVNGVSGMIIKWEFLYFTTTMSVIMNIIIAHKDDVDTLHFLRI